MPNLPEAHIKITRGLKPDGTVLINSSKSVEELGIGEAVGHLPEGHVITVPATELALKHLKRPTPNTVLLGAFAAVSEVLEMEGVEKAILEKFPGNVGEMNVAAAKAGYAATQSGSAKESPGSC